METQIYTGLCEFVRTFSNIEKVMRGLQNRSRLPERCAIITFISKKIHGTPVTHFNVQTRTETVGSQVTARYQLDCFGKNSYDEISKLRIAYTSWQGINFLNSFGIDPIWITEIDNLTAGTQINEQYVERYMMELEIAYLDKTEMNLQFLDDIKFKARYVQ